MSLRILAVGMNDVKTFGQDMFWVQVSPTEVMQYEVHASGRVIARGDERLPLDRVAAAVEKFNAAFYVEEPVEVDRVGDLVDYLGKFQVVSPTRCRLRR